MSNMVYKVVELVGTSDESITKAIDAAITKASPVHPPSRLVRGHPDAGGDQDGKAHRYQVTLKAGFTLES